MPKLSIENVNVASKRILTRVDFNVPLDDIRRVTDDRRIREALPTIRSIVDRGGRAILMSHLGRPDKDGYEARYSLAPVADALAKHLGRPVGFPSTDCIDNAAAQAVSQMTDGDVLLLENLRFHRGETKNATDFAAHLASYGEIYCNDAFGSAHRAHASIVGVPESMPGAPRAAGLLLLKEVKYLSETLEHPVRPFVAILGGAKVSDKLGAVRNLLDWVDIILIGGAMAYTFLHVLGRRMGRSRIEHDMLDEAHEIIELAAERRADLFFPNDHVCGKEISEQTPVKVFEDHIEGDWMGLDIGPQTQERFAAKVREGRTIVWNGPLGVFEVDPFDVGTRLIAEQIADATDGGAISVIGGGDTAAAVDSFGLADRYSHVSTGGGASLEMMEGRDLPGITVLDGMTG